ncbi:MAG: DegT/DnrJ/EryC1/StrS family aminotransferase [Fodinibius sp.]|nr:DegT/DnrJ/EryC1/StrS family aminotransferase [Fodinibius sp.]
MPVHMLPYYKQFGWEKGDFPNAERYYERCISLPMYPTLSEEQQEFVIEKVLKVVG